MGCAKRNQICLLTEFGGRLHRIRRALCYDCMYLFSCRKLRMVLACNKNELLCLGWLLSLQCTSCTKRRECPTSSFTSRVSTLIKKVHGLSSGAEPRRRAPLASRGHELLGRRQAAGKMEETKTRIHHPILPLRMDPKSLRLLEGNGELGTRRDADRGPLGVVPPLRVGSWGEGL